MNRGDFEQYLKQCTDVDELKKLATDFRDILIQIMPILINTEQRVGKKDRLRRRFQEIVAERYGV